jgi:hypothetical protein
MGCTASTEPQCLYSRAIPLLPLWAVRPVQSLSACTRVHFTLHLPKSEHECLKNTEKTNSCFETTDSTTYWYVTSYTCTTARTPNIRAFHRQSFNFAITYCITSAVNEWERRIRNRGVTGDWHNCFELATPHRGPQWLFKVEWRHQRRATKLTQFYEWYGARQGRRCT